jgi:hypothetical protein
MDLGKPLGPRVWNRRFTEFLAKHGLVATPQDPCVYTTQTNPIILLAIFVDDGLIASPNRAQTDLILKDMDDVFKIRVESLTTPILLLAFVSHETEP